MNIAATSSETETLLLTPSVREKRYYRIGLTVSLLFFAQNFINAVFNNQILYQSCTAVFYYNETKCKLLGTDKTNGDEELQDIEQTVEAYAANILMCRSLIEAIMPAIICLFLGPWSDKFGRKPVMLLVSAGYCLTYFLVMLLIILSSYSNINPWFYILLLIPAGFGGGTCSMQTISYAYIADLSTVENRPTRIGVIGFFVALGLTSGLVSSSYIYAATNALTIFAIAGGACGVALVYTKIFVEESLEEDDIERIDVLSKIRGLFKLHLIMEVFQSCGRKLIGTDRIIVWGTLIATGLSAFEQNGVGTVFYLYVREKFAMTITEYNTYSAISLVTLISGAAVGLVILHKLFRISEVTLTLLSLGSGTLESIIKATASKKWHLYLAIGIGFLKALRIPMCQFLLTRVVSSHDIGKVFSLSTAIETIIPLGSVPLYTYIYSSTLTTYPGAFSILSSAILLVSYTSMAVVFGAVICAKQNRLDNIS